MLAEVYQTNKWLVEKFGSVATIVPGTYAVPTNTSKGPAFMKVIVNEDMKMSGFTLWIDEELTQSWYK